MNQSNTVSNCLRLCSFLLYQLLAVTVLVMAVDGQLSPTGV